MTDHEQDSIPTDDRYQVDLRTGTWIFFLLAVFTAGEFIAALVAPTLGWLLIIVALPKAYFVISDYMHIRSLWSADEDGHG